MSREKIEIKCHDMTLEGVFYLPEGKGPFGVVVVCHPHPLYGGSMNNNVVDAVCRGVEDYGLAWLKFNFRGVGRSGGSHGKGVKEREDLKAAIGYAEGNSQVDAGRIGVCGYSFGSIVAFPVAVEDKRVKAVAGVSPFVQPADLLNNCVKPKLFLCGTNDNFVKHTVLEQLMQVIPEPKELALFPGTDHFWRGNEDKISAKAGSFFARYL